MRLSSCGFMISLSLVIACNNNEPGKPPVSENKTDSLTEEQRHLPSNALKDLTVAEGLQVRAFATEPMLKNPTNIDVDDRGRVWVTEAYNYRPAVNGNPVNPEGDRIMILEDNDGDGHTDTAKVFYQGPELNAPLGICVLGNRVLVSQSPYVWAFYDDNGDDKADRKEILFQGIGGEQHDHGMHALSFGPDGKLYFNMGNEGHTLKDKNGKTVLDQDGDEISQKKYKMGLVFRCDPDGSHVECLGQNFRNNYEVAVDSYGGMWQSDNDDDGNRGVRINYVMDYGNYGYTDEMTGASWQANRTNIEDSIPFRHWHLNDPGVVPNLLQTGAGSPTGLVVYEGSLLPKQFQGQMIHSDAGPNVVRSYPVTKKGAGYTATIVNILKNEKDQWFRPADVCVAPDGSLIVADWYDPGVGGHAAGDQQRGRIYRVAPPGTGYEMPKFDYTTPSGAVKALQNPNLSARYHAWTSLQAMGGKATPDLEKLWRTSADQRMRARAFWALVKMPDANDTVYINEAIKDGNSDIRILALRAARESKKNVIGVVKALMNDADRQVLRECALSLHHNKSPEAAAVWASLATKHDGNDRWYLEALGIGADQQWDKFFAAFVSLVKDPLQSPAYRDIVWRARCEQAVPYLASLANQSSDLYTRLRYFRAFDFHTGPSKLQFLVKMIADTTAHNPEFDKVVLHHLDPATVKRSPAASSALRKVVASLNGSAEYIEMVKKYNLVSEMPNLSQIAIEKQGDAVGEDAAGLLLDMGGEKIIWNLINSQSNANGIDTAKIFGMLRSLGRVGSAKSLNILQQIAFSKKYAQPLRQQAARHLGESNKGEDLVMDLLDRQKTPGDLKPLLAQGIANSWRGSVRDKAAAYISGTAKQTSRKMPSMKELLGIKANAAHGKEVFKNNCAVCHQVASEGANFGPKLTEIGSKLPKEGILDAILHPSAGISFGFEGWEVTLRDGSTLSGIISSKTGSELELRFPGGSSKKFKTSEIASRKEIKESMMSSGLHELMNDQQLADLLEYMAGLKKK